MSNPITPIDEAWTQLVFTVNKMVTSQWLAATEHQAQRLADANQVEEAWCLRGVVDALAGRDCDEGAREAGSYRGSYLRGYRAIEGA